MSLPLWQIPTSELIAELDRRKKNPPLTQGVVASVMQAVASTFRVTQANILSKKRDRDICRARFAAWMILSDRGFMNATIASAFNRADQGSIRHGIIRGRVFIGEDRNYARAVKIAMDVLAGAASSEAEPESEDLFLWSLESIDQRRSA